MIKNAADNPIFYKGGTIPDVSGAMQDYFQQMTFTMVAKIVAGFQVSEVASPLNFPGVIQPFTDEQLMQKPEGQRTWTWYLLHADPVLELLIDDVVLWDGKQTRVMDKKNFRLYGFVEYSLVQDWTGAGP